MVMPSVSRPFPLRFPDLFYFFFPRRPEPAGAEAADVCGGGREGGDTRTRGDQTSLNLRPRAGGGGGGQHNYYYHHLRGASSSPDPRPWDALSELDLVGELVINSAVGSNVTAVVNFAELNMTDTRKVDARDIWARKDIATAVSGSITVDVPAQDSAFILLTPT